jgi:signal transduction histidine kinase
VDTTIVPFVDERGKPFQYTAIRYEITERKRTEELLREQAALARLGQMAAVVAHEVKNPIAGIRGALQVIGSRMPAESRDKSIVGDIISRLDALNGVVHDLLVFARPRELRAEPVDLRALVTSTAEMIARDPAMRGLEVTVSGPDAMAQGDREQLQILFHNLLTNAGQAMGGTGRVEVEMRPAPRGWTVSVADHGPGMPPEVREKAFEAFFTTKHRGTGLGLPAPPDASVLATTEEAIVRFGVEFLRQTVDVGHFFPLVGQAEADDRVGGRSHVRVFGVRKPTGQDCFDLLTVEHDYLTFRRVTFFQSKGMAPAPT